MEINYDLLMLGEPIPYSDNITIYVPTIKDMIVDDDKEFVTNTKIFTTSVREVYSVIPEQVDEIEERFPTFWDLAQDKDGNEQIGKTIYGEESNITLYQGITKGLAYWTHTNKEDYQVLSNGNIINANVDWVIDREEFERFCNWIKAITLYEPNWDLIAPKNMKPHQLQIWKNSYKGRVRKLQRQPVQSIGDKIIILQVESNSYIPFSEIGKMTYFQFINLLKGYGEKENAQTELAIYTSYKFDTSKMKLTDWREKISTVNRD